VRLVEKFKKMHFFQTLFLWLAAVSLEVPHSVALLERLDVVCIADRENERVVCPSAGLRASPEREPLIIQGTGLGRVFAIAPHGKHSRQNGQLASSIPLWRKFSKLKLQKLRSFFVTGFWQYTQLY